MDTDNSVVKTKGKGMGAGWRGAKEGNGDICNSINHKNKEKIQKDSNSLNGINGIIFESAFSNCLLPVYRNTINFLLLTLYLGSLLDSP